MPTISPTVTVHSTPGIQVSIDIPGLTYQALLNMLGVVVFKVNTVYYYAPSAAQFANAVQYSQYDADGNASSTQIVTPISPQQYQSTMFVQLATNGVIINGQSAMTLLMLGMTCIQLIFYADRIENEDAIDAAGYINNFKEVERDMGLEGFFEDPGASGGGTKIEFIPDCECDCQLDC
jgi:hypothetical protein